MTVFADSSAIVKRYADEPGHESVRTIEGPVVISALARVEVVAAVWRKQRMGELSLDDAQVLVGAFEADLAGGGGDDAERGSAVFVEVRVSEQVLDLATRLVARHGLRAYDGVQLASAVLSRDAIGGPFTFAAFDDHLCAAAAREGFALGPHPA
ncbi:MAG: type II toxin-antitoxin system VapC family toxin [Acidimicrobiales bacterium]|nr:type II toxin-antitoxin system VapC family toxin [Acidimicrobiales bacterium]